MAATTVDTHRGSTWRDSTVRRRTFAVIRVLVALWLTALVIFPLTEAVFVWLPADVVVSIVGDGGAGGSEAARFEAHRSHLAAIALLGWAVVLCAYAQWRGPERRLGSLRLLVVLAIAMAVAYSVSGGLRESLVEEGAFVVPIALLAAFHPRAADLVAWRGWNGPMLVAALVALAPLAWHVVANMARQVGGDDPHAVDEHWATAALLGVLIAAGALMGASRADGWRLPAWIAVGAATFYGVHSLAYPGNASGWSMVGAAVAVAWAVVFGVLASRRARAERRTAGDGAPATTDASPA